ncbi:MULTISPECIES: 3-hydroxyacyl-CoA dehydrogenase family protein [Gordonia]|uniref:Putative 3-hydroxyacyl-CoA dehydrogenase n=1 Tax=Gordonia sputi NBRC 100414 TaxID=1089453 RepID=H5U452_9ACTN|nr:MULTISPECIES: 3-hydroxyacyl-CoA dehydrogenase family protein [Gordonia]NKY92415.1 3-hydroxyacyl-CoA dehydrogenase family protein [Gordonia sputi]OBA38309.1 3-hydroxybutyryl-CoA dehydrogenase [Gordonia sp. 852002-51296_SCH5728562-b]GAB40510.1 putative 3-hydroxyacyl-CoA dehydrogenase [Gordonia sputi NBRC 100414]
MSNYAKSLDDVDARPVAVVGAGTLGRRIALMFSTRGGEVRIFDQSADQREAAAQYVDDTIDETLKIIGKGVAGKVIPASTLADAVAGAWLVVEAVPERLDIKIPLWGEIDAAADDDAIFATNSSSYASSTMIENVRNPERMCNMHFYMPPMSNAVDLMSDGETARDVLDSLLVVLPEFGIHPFEARRESTGFIFNRIWAAIKRESLEVVAEGVSTPHDIDEMFKINWHMPTGPFAMMDSVGLDVVLDIENHYAAENPNLPTGPRELLERYVDDGKLGRKTGEGFYTYE